MSNQILPFGISAGANVIPYADYEALPARSGGFVSGVARSEQLNTVWRQSSFVASVLAQFIASRSGQDVLDDGDTIKLLTNLELAIKTYANNNLPAASTTVAGIAKLSSEINSSSEVLAATPKAVKAVSDASLKATNNLSEIKSAGATAVASTLANLGLKEAAKRDVGTGVNQIPDMSAFTSGPGWMKFPDGTIIQFGTNIAGSAGYPTSVNFPVPFTADFRVTCSFDSPTNTADCPAFSTSKIGNVGFYLASSRQGSVTGAGAHWIAIGK
ncbi:tail fiber protein [Yersinia aldovae]|uniref:Tail fiber repeat 2-containing protein n=1 Tax=Yersinia aldovae TaxID=29483 RepID=A0ABM9SSJ6_YERAL|nr:phage tail protein [Yersinia aldovae]CNK97522.1 tail fiber repeat 2-containing protein [Yersinia aldovae]